MRSRTKTGLLAVALVAALALFVAAEAEAAGVCLQSGPSGCEKYQTSGGWVMEIARGTGAHAGEFPVYCSGTDTSSDCVDTRGRTITGYRFAYQITAPLDGYSHSISQADVLCSDCGEGNRVSILYPENRAIKMLKEDPNTLYGFGTPDYVVAFDALKLDSSNHSFVAVYTTQAGAGQKGALLVTSDGYQYVDEILGPTCCSPTPGVSAIELADGSTVNFDTCTGDFASTNLTPVSGNLWVCWDTGCNTIKKIGPRSGSFLDVLVQWNADGTYNGTRYYGYGNKFFKTDVLNQTPPVACTDPIPYAIVEQTITLDNIAKVTYNNCGDISTVTDIDDNPAQQTSLSIFESYNNGKMNTNAGGEVVNSGPRLGGMLYTNPWIVWQGRLVYIPPR